MLSPLSWFFLLVEASFFRSCRFRGWTNSVPSVVSALFLHSFLPFIISFFVFQHFAISKDCVNSVALHAWRVQRWDLNVLVLCYHNLAQYFVYNKHSLIFLEWTFEVFSKCPVLTLSLRAWPSSLRPQCIDPVASLHWPRCSVIIYVSSSLTSVCSPSSWHNVWER